MGNIVNIAFQGGTHGHFLRYFIDKFSKLTPPITKTPFTNTGTSHMSVGYSDRVTQYHPFKELYEKYKKKLYYDFQNDNFININEPHIFVTIDKEDVIFTERLINIRAGDLKQNLNSNVITLSSEYIEQYNINSQFNKLYNKTITEETKIPKYIFRDFYKISFLDLQNHKLIKNNKKLLNILPKNTILFPANAFWNKEKFFENISNVNKKFNLKIDINDPETTEIYNLFYENINYIDSKDRIYEITNAIKNKKNMDISNIDPIEQAYISAWIEKNYNFITIPRTNNFFNTTNEIIQWLDWYPNHYKAMNPNLPKFNGIPNPFYLHGKQK